MAAPPHMVDILHPYASLKWRECMRSPVREIRDAQAVLLGDKVYVGGGQTSRGANRLCMYNLTTDEWSLSLDTPVSEFALIAYQSYLVLVGGKECSIRDGSDRPATSKLRTMIHHDEWRETLPPMTTKRQCASAIGFTGNIVVAGGKDDKRRVLDTVEVYNGQHWAKAHHLPEPCSFMKSAVLTGHWYLMGGRGQDKEVYYASLDSLVASCQPGEKPLPSVWKRLPDVPHERSSTAVFGKRLIAVGREHSLPSSSIHAYSPHIQSWIHVGNMPVKLQSTCTTVLPTGQLMVMGRHDGISVLESYVYTCRTSLNVTFDSDSQFTIEALSRLEQIGITSLREIEAYKRPLQSVIGVYEVDLSIDNSFSFLKMWVQGCANLRPTWRHLFWALREIKLNRLADQIEAFLSRVAVEQAAPSNLEVSPVSEEMEGREEDYEREQEFGDELSATSSSGDGWTRDFQYLIRNQFLRIKEIYVTLLYKVRTSLGKKISPSKILAYLFSEYDNVYNNAHSKTTSLFSDADKKELDLAISVDQIFQVLCKYWSFFKCDILYGIVHHCGDHEDQALIKEYQEELKSFFNKRKISEVPEILVSVNEEQDKIIIKVDKEDASWREITDLELKISAILGVTSSALLIAGVQQECKEITFCIPRHISQLIFSKPLTRKQINCFGEASVLYLSCGDVHWRFFERRSSEHDKEDATRLSCHTTDIIFTTDEEKHIAAVQKAVEERRRLDHTIIHGVFVGPAHSGKNSLMERLLGRMPSSVSPSTGVAESVVQVEVQKSATVAANVKELIWSVMDYDDEAIRLICDSQDTVHQLEKLTVSNIHVPKVLGTTDIEVSVHDQIDISKAVTVVEEDSSLLTAKDSVLVEESSSQSVDQLMPHSSLHDSQQRCQLPDSYVPPLEIVKLALRKKGKVPIEILQQDFQKTWSLYLTNIGGQMEFQELLPLLVSGPSMFFFTFRIDRDLNERYVVEYKLSGETKVEPYTSSFTTIEVILQTLASIAAMGTFIYKGIQRSTVPLRPKVFLVGTHKDKLDSKTADEHIARVDHQLQEAIKSTAHYKDIVQFSSAHQLIFTVNNFSESDTDFISIRLALERIASKKEFQMTPPAHWLIFSLVLRKLKPNIISYRVAQEIAKHCGVFGRELDEALHFIHSKLGLIRYFPYEAVKDMVVIHPQFLFDKVTELIVDTFIFENAGKYEADQFKHKGVFSLSEFERISSRKDTSIKPFQFAKLLERLRIASSFQVDRNQMYFFPSALAHTSMEAPLQQLSLICNQVPHIMVTFECGYCPKGLPGTLITYLMANEMQSSLLWKLHYDKIFRNQVYFKVGPLDTVVLKVSSTFLEIECVLGIKCCNRESIFPVYKLCEEVYTGVDAGIRQVTADINYVNAEHSFTFPCVCKEYELPHPGVLEYIDDALVCLTCSKTGDQQPFPAGYEVWNLFKAKKSGVACTPAEYSPYPPFST